MKTIDKKFIAAVALITIGVVLRLLQWTPNFSPVTAIALFGGACLLDKRWSLVIPLVSLFIGDVLLAFMNHYQVFHDTIFFIYSAFLLIALLGWALRGAAFSYLRVGGFAVLSSVLFFLISNFGVWIAGTLYPQTWEGLTACFTMAIPFFKYTLLGDVVYTIIFFGVYQAIINVDKKVSTEAVSR